MSATVRHIDFPLPCIICQCAVELPLQYLVPYSSNRAILNGTLSTKRSNNEKCNLLFLLSLSLLPLSLALSLFSFSGSDMTTLGTGGYCLLVGVRCYPRMDLPMLCFFLVGEYSTYVMYLL